MWVYIIIGASAFAGIGLGIFLARLSRKGILVAVWLVTIGLAAALWLWVEAQPGLDGLGVAAAVLLILLPFFAGSLVSGLVVWARYRNGGEDK